MFPFPLSALLAYCFSHLFTNAHGAPSEAATMMKWRLRASLLHLFSGEHSLVSAKTKLILLNRCNAGVENSVLSYSTRTAPYIRTSASFQLKGVESLKRSLHSSTEDDDFSDLGALVRRGVGSLKQSLHASNEDGDFSSELGPVRRGGLAIPKLMTEKPERFSKTNDKRKVSSGSSSPAESSPSLKDLFPSLRSSSSALDHKLGSRNNVSGSNLVNKSASYFRDSSSVTIQNVPSTVKLSQLRSGMKGFGKILDASIRALPDGFNCCDIEFQSEQASRKAIAVGQIKVKNFDLLVRPLHVRRTVTIRISNLNSMTADSAIHGMCMSYGPLEGLVRIKEDVVDALFGVEDKSDTESILEKLNNTVMDDCKWSVHLQSRGSTSEGTTKSDDAQDQLALHISGCKADLERQFLLFKVYLEDFENLYHALLHLESNPCCKQ